MKTKCTGLLAIVLCASMFFVGCSVSQFESVLNEVAPAALDILQIVALFTGNPVNTSVTTKISADVSSLEALYKDFNTANAASKGSIKAEINAGFSTLNSDLSTVFAVAQVSDPATQTKVKDLIALIETGVDIAEAVIPLNAGAPVHTMTASELATSYNKVLTAKTGNPMVDNYTKSHTIHNHNSLVRHLSFGIAK